ncbi:DNRLRE domain-containing protein [Arthrobacter woluwensis]|uniref:DNRLRE domain-containing protein n=1 Tax=Arthrobacter woluwensis TaxID=156980 RepID=UPI001AAF461F|nr:DNRLRE domain-containing protein [Arthrobacter woluwensis]QTF73191.1 DNRLRE domain-containing protein [Arthrobacter woluwensis]
MVVDSLTTETSVTTAQADGTLQVRVSSEPVRVKEGTTWHQIDTDLKSVDQEGKPRLVPKHVFADVSLAKGGSDVMAYVGDHRGAAVTQKWPFGALPEPVVDGDTATYSEVLPGVDLVQIASSTGVSQVLKVKTREALKDPRVMQMRFFLHVDGATVKDRGDGKGLVAVTADGKAALETAEGQWWDSSWEGSSASGPGGPGLTYPLGLSLSAEGDQQVQKLGMSGILSAKKLTFPVFVDPEWTSTNPGFTYIDSAWPTMSYWNGAGGMDGSVHVGYLRPEDDYTLGKPHTTRGIYQFSTSGVQGRKVIKAVLNVTEVWSYSCTATPVSAWLTTAAGAGTTWNNQPTWQRKLATATVAKGYSPSCPGDKVGFDVSALNGNLSTWSQVTLGLGADHESDPYGWKRFHKAADLIMSYDLPPAAPDMWGMSGGRWVGTPWTASGKYYTRYSAPNFDFFSNGDPDGNKGGNITLAVTVRNSAGTVVQSGTTAPGSPLAQTHFTWQSGVLSDGSYTVEAFARDQYGLTSGTLKFNFIVDTTPPGAPDIVAPASLGGQTVTGSTAQGVGRDDSGVVGKTPYKFGVRYTGKFGGNQRVRLRYLQCRRSAACLPGVPEVQFSFDDVRIHRSVRQD